MWFKMDKNLPVELANAFREAGHDAVTVLDRDLNRARDSDHADAERWHLPDVPWRRRRARGGSNHNWQGHR